MVPSRFNAELGLGLFPVTVIDQADGYGYVRGEGQARADPLRQGGDSRRKGAPRGTDRPRWRHGATVGRPARRPHLGDEPDRRGQGHRDRVRDRQTGTWQVGDSPTDNAHAWIVGFTPHLGIAVWVGNKAEEKAIEDKAGKPITGATLPAAIYRAFVTGAYPALKLDKAVKFPAPKYTGDATVGNAGTSG